MAKCAKCGGLKLAERPCPKCGASTNAPDREDAK
jgi:ribosomal protein L32